MEGVSSKVWEPVTEGVSSKVWELVTKGKVWGLCSEDWERVSKVDGVVGLGGMVCPVSVLSKLGKETVGTVCHFEALADVAWIVG